MEKTAHGFWVSWENHHGLTGFQTVPKKTNPASGPRSFTMPSRRNKRLLKSRWHGAGSWTYATFTDEVMIDLQTSGETLGGILGNLVLNIKHLATYS